MIHLYIDCHAHLFFNPIPSDTISEDIIGDVPYPNLDFLSKSISDARNEGVRYIVGVISNPNLFLHYEDQIKLENIIHIITKLNYICVKEASSKELILTQLGHFLLSFYC